MLAVVLLLCVYAPASPASSRQLGSDSGPPTPALRRCCESASPGSSSRAVSARLQLFLRGGGAASPIRPAVGSSFNSVPPPARGIPDFLSFVSGAAATDGGQEESGGLQDEAAGGEPGHVDFAGMSALRCGIDCLLARGGEGGRLAMLDSQAPPTVNPAWRASSTAESLWLVLHSEAISVSLGVAVAGLDNSLVVASGAPGGGGGRVRAATGVPRS